MKTVTLFLFIMALTFEVFAFENANISKGYSQQQHTQVQNYALNEQHSQKFTRPYATSSITTEAQVAEEYQNELVTEIVVYCLIVLVYSLYWQINKKLAD